MSVLRRFFCISLLSGVSMVALSQELPMRIFPPSAKFAMLRIAPNYDASLNTAPVRLSPGMRLFTPQNMMVLPHTIVNQPVKVAYTLDTQGFVQQAWMLSENEVKNVPTVDRGLLSFSSKPFQ